MNINFDKNGKLIIPRGYRRLRAGTRLQRNDLCNRVSINKWRPTHFASVQIKSNWNNTYIREISNK